MIEIDKHLKPPQPWRWDSVAWPLRLFLELSNMQVTLEGNPDQIRLSGPGSLSPTCTHLHPPPATAEPVSSSLFRCHTGRSRALVLVRLWRFASHLGHSMGISLHSFRCFVLVIVSYAAIPSTKHLPCNSPCAITFLSQLSPRTIPRLLK